MMSESPPAYRAHNGERLAAPSGYIPNALQPSKSSGLRGSSGSSKQATAGSSLTPYYADALVTIYCGDARELLPALPAVDCVITDPVWPNSSRFLAGADRPNELWAEACQLLKTNRLVVHLGCDSDPRFLRGVPASLPFLRVCWLEYACPTRKGRILYTGDVAYVFGTPIKSAPGRRLMPGRYMATPTSDDIKRNPRTPHKEFGGEPHNGDHPCPRRYQHAAWLVGRFADGVICDPFAGSGTTMVAAKRAGIPSVGIEIEERYCEIAAKRLQQEMLNLAPSELMRREKGSLCAA